ncbi:hypothetical protein Tco_0520090 [Tanacetum coccineum]
MRLSSMNIITNLSKYGLRTWFMRDHELRLMINQILRRFRIILEELGDGQVLKANLVVRGSFVSAVPGQMTYLVASLTPDSASISPEGFLPSILLLVVIIATVVVTVVVVVAVGGVPSILKLLFMVIDFLVRQICWANEFHQNRASSSMLATLSATSFLMAARVMADASDVDVLLGGIYQHKKTWNKNDITRSGGGIGGSLAVALYACIYGSLCKGGMASEDKRDLDKLSGGSGEMFLGEAGK